MGATAGPVSALEGHLAERLEYRVVVGTEVGGVHRDRARPERTGVGEHPRRGPAVAGEARLVLGGLFGQVRVF